MQTINNIIVRKPSDEEIQVCQNWPIWQHGVDKFDWEYTQTEKCLILEGRVTVTDDPETGPSVSFGPGDFVCFPVGLKCIWKVTEPVKKHYDFE